MALSVSQSGGFNPISQYVGAINRGFNDLRQQADALDRLVNGEKASISAGEKESLGLALDYITQLRTALEAIGNPIPVTKIGSRSVNRSEVFTDPATVSSSSDIVYAGTAATLGSSEEVNTATTSYGPAIPTFGGASTAGVTISGTYDGRYGDDTLTFNVVKGGTVGTDRIELRVDDSLGAEVARLDVDPFLADTPYAILDKTTSEDTGLRISLSAGTVADADSFDLTLSSSTPSAIDPAQALDGADANLQDGFSVTAGDYEINGTTITLNAGDTLNDVISAITASAAGVTAAYDAGSDTFTLTQKSTGSGNPITLGPDATGLFAALKLDDANTVAGTDGGSADLLAGSLPAISSGNININGTLVAVDVNVDSLDDVVNRINGAGLGATATLADGRLTLTADDTESTLTVDGNGTGFFAAVNLANGSYDPTSDVRSVPTSKRTHNSSLSAARVIANHMAEVAAGINGLFGDAGLAQAPGEIVSTLRNRINAAVTQSFSETYARYDENDRRFDSTFGVDVDLRGIRDDIFRFGKEERGELISSLVKDRKRVNELLYAASGDENDGLFERLLSAARSAEAELKERYGSLGLFLNTSA